MGRYPRWLYLAALALLPALAVGCGGGSSSGGQSGGGGTLVLLDVSVGDYDGVPLNEIIEFEFSSPLDPDTVRADTIQIREGPNYGKQVPGFFEVQDKKVLFYPRLPTLPDLSDGGLKAGTDYQITLPGQPKVAVVRDYVNNRLAKKTVVSFRTATAGSPNLFRDNFIDPLPPQVLFMNPPDGAEGVPADSDITLTFNRRPLQPATVTTSNITLTMIERMGVKVNRPISGTPTLTQSHDSVVIRYVPTFPLADDARYRLEVDRRVQDLVGNDIDPSWIAEFGIRDEPARFAHVDWTYDDAEKVSDMDTENTTASWNEAEEDALAALFTVAGGNGTAGDLTPVANQQFDPSDFPRGHEILTQDGIEYDVYNFRTIEIPANVVVRFVGDSANRPAKLLALKPIILNGTLTVSGGDGEDADGAVYNSKLDINYGGDCGPGGTPGATSTQTTKITIQNTPPEHADSVPEGGEGGRGGELSGYTYYSWSGGGGGGGSRTAGKDGKGGGYTYSSTYNGKGGKGGKSTEQRGYDANVERTPNVGGAGGGAGGIGYYYYYPYRNDGASGGGGGGGITVQGASSILVGSTGKILANGGIGGDNPGQSYSGGAGGGGGGGGILIRATGTMTFQPAATLDVSAGSGGAFTGTYSGYAGGQGGDGGVGYIRLEAREDENSPGTPLIFGQATANFTYADISVGLFSPKGGGAPSVGQTLWQNLGVFDPTMEAPKVEDIVATLYNDTMTVEVQMAIEDQNNLGNPNTNSMDVTDTDGDGQYDDTLDPTKLTEWTKLTNIESLNGNGFQFLRTRVTFQLDDNQTADHPLPFLDYLRVRFRF